MNISTNNDPAIGDAARHMAEMEPRTLVDGVGPWTGPVDSKSRSSIDAGAQALAEQPLAEGEAIRAASHTETRLAPIEIGWLSDHGPYPFVCNQGRISWPFKTDVEVLTFLDNYVAVRGGLATPALIAMRIRDKIDVVRAAARRVQETTDQ